ncbi:MAG: serine/threonine-protein kinase [Deltaproteobacteria bacterium]|nr:serine/threonine-protein kinase [Deltaproteobacteria bacterium]
MKPDDRWNHADRLFNAALDLPQQQRTSFLDEACGEDAELRQLLDRLLQGADEEEKTLTPGGSRQGAVWGGLMDELREPAAPTGDLVGRYRLEKEIGRGGMAVVFLAQRADGQFEQQVAVKRIQQGIASPDGIRRFEQERAILARMRHPNIAQLLDGGVDAKGRPYLVMEHVDGQPIDTYCDSKCLPLKQRLELFLQVARGVDAAHRNLVIHRDLKPSNILVNTDGYAKLLDFGIAKLLAAEDEAAGLDLTRTDARVMTPIYASPEQVRGEVVTTSSDVYQLGLLLFLLLSGRWPYQLGEHTPVEVLRAICDDEPARPSTAVTRKGAYQAPAGGRGLSPEEISSARSTTGGRLKRILSGDLDNIVLKALRKEPDRRYRSVAQLIDDLERYLVGRTVTARPDTFLYRAGKFARRNRAAVATAVAGVLLLAALAVFYTARLTQQRDRATTAAAEANQVATFLRGLFGISAPTRSKGEQITARDMLDRGAQRVEAELSGQPPLQAEMMTLMGDVYRELALYDEAEPLLTRALELRRSQPGEHSLELAETLHSSARLDEADGRVDQALAAYSQALEIRQNALQEGIDIAPQVAATLNGLGRVQELQGRFAAAEASQRHALAIQETVLGGHHQDVGLTLMHLGEVLKEVREHEEAKGHLKRALVTLERHFEPDHPHIAQARVLLGDTLRFTGDNPGAKVQYEAALGVVETAYGPEHPEVAVVLNKLGNLLNAMKDPDGAVAMHERALAIRRAAYGEESALVAGSLNNLGRVYWTNSRLDEAIRFLKSSLELKERVLGADHVDVAISLINLAGALRDAGRLEEAVAPLGRALEIREQAYGEEHSLLAVPLLRLGRLLLALRTPEPAEPMLRRALALGRHEPPYLLPEVIWARLDLSRCLRDLGGYEEAESLLLANLDETQIDLFSKRKTLSAIVELLTLQGRPDAAEPYARLLKDLPEEP